MPIHLATHPCKIIFRLYIISCEVEILISVITWGVGNVDKISKTILRKKQEYYILFNDAFSRSGQVRVFNVHIQSKLL